MLVAVPEAHADCTPDPVEVNGIVICSGLDTDGFNSDVDGISVTVVEGSEVTVTNSRAIVINAKNGSFLNQGSITGNLDFGYDGLISLIGSGTTGINEGTILTSSSGSALSLNQGVSLFENREGAIISSDGFRGAVNLSFSFNGQLINSGTISSANRIAISAFTSSSSGSNNKIVITNNVTGVIEGETGIYNFGGDFLDITNHGTIRGNIGVNIDEYSILTNEETGLIAAAQIANYAPYTALHSSAVGSTGKATFINKGTINSESTAVLGGAYTLNNSGNITGNILGNDDNHAVVNSGTISGLLDLGYGRDLFENSGTVNGNVALGGDADVFRDFGGAISGTVQLGDGDDILGCGLNCTTL